MSFESEDKTSSKIADNDCLGCRIVSGGGLILASVYVGYHAGRNRNTVGRTLTFLFSGALGGIGLTRLLKLPPFNSKIQSIKEG
ncbi:hypothetical protein SK128_020718 [Halocaridina rubra]|uniref:Distal membrane-arm assembly complex protein 1-like domain-containing protein n=1 Tax=Halocaridina rubra TaxID=373956 RepID=A0AAN9AAR9_HALRR